MLDGKNEGWRFNKEALSVTISLIIASLAFHHGIYPLVIFSGGMALAGCTAQICRTIRETSN